MCMCESACVCVNICGLYVIYHDDSVSTKALARLVHVDSAVIGLKVFVDCKCD